MITRHKDFKYKFMLAFAAILLSLNFTAVKAYTNNSFYVTAGLGEANMDSPGVFNNIIINPANPNNIVNANFGTHYSFTGNIGFGYQFTLNPRNQIGVELAYSNYGSAKYNFTKEGIFGIKNSSLEIEQQSVDLLAVYRLHFNSKWYGTVKAGAAMVTQTVNSAQVYINVMGAGTEPLGSYSKRKVKPVFVIGGGYNFTQKLSLGLLFKYLQGKDASSENINQLTQSKADIYASHSFLLQLSYAF